jgi:hypothetical protein
MASTTASPASNAHQFARTVFFLAVALQLPLVPLLPYAADGESVDKQAEPEYSSPLQVPNPGHPVSKPIPTQDSTRLSRESVVSFRLAKSRPSRAAIWLLTDSRLARAKRRW